MKITKNSHKNKCLRLTSNGFTIVELLIFIAVSTALFVSAMMLVGGRQHKTEFQTGVNEFVQQMQSIANDVSSGNYERPLDVSCSVDALGNVLLGVGGNPGTSSDCIFIGRAVQFAPSGNADEYNTFSLVGRRQIRPSPTSAKRDIRSLSEANAQILAPRTVRIPGGLEIKNIGGGNSPAVIAFYTDFAQGADPLGGSQIESGARNVRAVPISGTNMGDPFGMIEGIVEANTNETPGQVVLCLEHSAAGMSALVAIGSTGGSTTVSSQINQGGCI